MTANTAFTANPNRFALFLTFLLCAAIPGYGLELRGEDYHLELKGEKIFALQHRSKIGGMEGFSTGFLRREHLQLNLSGNLGNHTKVDGQFEDAQSEAEPSIARLCVDNPAFRFRLGQFETDAGGPVSALSGRTLQGGQATLIRNHWSLTLLGSRAGGRAQSERFSFRGAGEYNLAGAPVLPGSERVFLNRILLQKERDYRLDAMAGTILLTPEFLIRAGHDGIGSQDIMSVVYETDDFESRPRIRAGWLTYSPDSMRLFEMSALEQRHAAEGAGAALYAGAGRVRWGYGRALDIAAQLRASARGDSAILHPALAGSGRLHSETSFFGLSAEADYREPKHVDLSKTEALPGRTLFGAAEARLSPLAWIAANTKGRQERFSTSDSSDAIERRIEGRLEIAPRPAMKLTGFGSLDSIGGTTRPGTSTEAGLRFEQSWTYYALNLSGRQKTGSFPAADSVERPVEIMLRTNRFSFLQTSTGLRYIQALQPSGSRNDRLSLDCNVSLSKGRQHLLATNLTELNPKGPPTFQTSLNGGAEAGGVRFSAAGMQRYCHEAAPDSVSAEPGARDTAMRPCDIHQAQIEINSGYGIDASLVGRMRLGRALGNPFAREYSLDWTGARDVAGFVKPEASAAMETFEQWNRNQFAPKKELNRSKQRLRMALQLARMGFVSSRIAWSGERTRDWQIMADDSLARVQKGMDQEYQLAADMAMSDRLSFIVQAEYDRELQDLESGIADADPLANPTALPPEMLFLNRDARTYKADVKATWQAAATAQLSAGIGFTRRHDATNADGTAAERNWTQTVLPQAEALFTIRPVDFGVQISGSASTGRYETKSIRGEPFVRVTTAEHVSAEARGRMEQGYTPFYRTTEFTLNARIGF